MVPIRYFFRKQPHTVNDVYYLYIYEDSACAYHINITVQFCRHETRSPLRYRCAKRL